MCGGMPTWLFLTLIVAALGVGAFLGHYGGELITGERPLPWRRGR